MNRTKYHLLLSFKTVLVSLVLCATFITSSAYSFVGGGGHPGGLPLPIATGRNTRSGTVTFTMPKKGQTITYQVKASNSGFCVTNAVITYLTQTSVDITWTVNQNATGTNVGMNPLVNPPVYTSFSGSSGRANSSYGAGGNTTQDNNGWYTVYSGTDNHVTVTGLTYQATYQIGFSSYDSGNYYDACVNHAYVSSPNPTIQASGITESSITATSATINWTNGNGAARAVFMNLASAGSSSPNDNVDYTASTQYGNGTSYNGWVCVYNGTGSAVSVTNLPSGTNMGIIIAEYFGTYGSANEKNLTGPVNTFSTLTPVLSVSNSIAAMSTTYGTVSAIAGGSFSVSGTNLTSGITLNAPAGIEISSTSSTSNFASSTYISTSGNTGSIPIYTRITVSAPASTVSGNVQVSSSGAATQYMAVSPSVVSPASLSITANNNTRNYGTAASGSGSGSTAFTPSGLMNGDGAATVTLTFAPADIGATIIPGTYAAQITPSALVGSGTYAAGNYSVTYPKGSIIISPKPITIIATGVNKLFDGGLAGTVTFSDNRVGTDVFTTTSAAPVFASKNTGPAVPENVSSLAISGGVSAYYTLTATTASTVAKISPAPVTVTAQTDTKTYNKTTASAGVPTVSSLYLGDVVSTAATQVFANYNASTAKTMNASGLVINDGNSGANYVISYTPNLTGIINPASVTVTAQPITKVYTATRSSAGVPTVSALISGDVVGTAPIEKYDTKNIGTGKIMTPSGLIVNDGNSGGNYLPVYQTNPGGSITVATATVTALTSTSGYTKTTASPVVPQVTGLLGTDAVGTAPVETYSTAPVGANKIMTPSGLVINDGNGGANYTVIYLTNSSGTINQAVATVTAQPDTQIYTKTTASAVAPVISGLAIGDQAAVLPVQTYDTWQTGTGKTMTASGLVINDGNGGANYTITYVTSTAGVINPAPVTVTAQAGTKIFDKTMSSMLVPVVSGLLSTDGITTNATQTFDTYNTGQGKTLTATGLVISDGNGGNNYTVSYQASTGGIIQPATVTVTASSDSKVYDGSTTSTATPAVSALFSGDIIGTGPVQSYDTWNAGSAKTLTPSGLVVNDGNSGNNYASVYVSSTTGTISPATATVTAQADTRPYDNTVNSAVVPTVAGLLSTDLTGTAPTQTFASNAVGSALVLTPAGLVVNDGNNGGNYTAIYQSSATGSITPAVLTYLAIPASKYYGTANPIFSGIITGFLGTDNTKNATTGTASYTSATTVTSPVGTYALTGSGLQAVNYTFVQASSNLTALTVGVSLPPGLSNLVPNTGRFTQSFTSSGLVYSLTVPNTTTYFTLTPTALNSSSITVKGSAVSNGVASTALALSVGVNQVLVVATSLSGVQLTYTVTVNRTGAANAILANLTISNGTLSPAYSQQVDGYTAAVGNQVSVLTVTPMPADQNATITVNGKGNTPGGNTLVSLNTGANIISVVTTAQDGVTQTTKTIVLMRETLPPLNSGVTANNLLTPNGDGKNDFWVIKDILSFPNNKVTVYARSGVIVFTQKGYANTWGGTFHGAVLADGTYYWIVDRGNGISGKGLLTILHDK